MQQDNPEVQPGLTPVTTTETTDPQSKRLQWMIIGGATLFLLLIVGSIVLMASNPIATEVVRDIAIVFVAVETFFIGMAMIVLILQIQALVSVLRQEIKPLLESVNDTASTVRGTTQFVSHNVVSPVIKMAGFSAAARQIASDVVGVFKGTRPRRKSSPNPVGGVKDGES